MKIKKKAVGLVLFAGVIVFVIIQKTRGISEENIIGSYADNLDGTYYNLQVKADHTYLFICTNAQGQDVQSQGNWRLYDEDNQRRIDFDGMILVMDRGPLAPSVLSDPESPVDFGTYVRRTILGDILISISSDDDVYLVKK